MASRALRDRTQTRLREIDQLVESIDLAEEYGDDATGLRARRDTLEAEYEELLLRVAAGHSTPTAFVDVATIQETLGPHELLVEYYIGGDTLYTFALSRDTIRVFETALPPSGILGRVRLIWEQLSDPSTDPARVLPALSAMWDMLLGPTERAGMLGSSTTLIVVPHGALNYLPFSALCSDAGYLTETHSVRLLPSASMLSTARESNNPAQGKFELFAPLPDELPGSRREIEAINGDRFVGRRATEQRLIRALDRSDVVHVATHGSMNFLNPLFSHIELAPGSGTLEDNGRFEVHELLDTPVRADLVFLSGCETGLGRAHTTQFARGEQHETLAQAFLHAGAGNVVATLWKVEDVGASVFARQFYSLLDRATPAEALAAVQRSLLQHDRYRHPYYWAAYQLTGIN
jgi:hypothetical protein